MKTYKDALLNATYKKGMPGERTDEHEKAEMHRFKTQFLFKETKIPKDLYVARLIQHFVIIKAIETQLQNLTVQEQSQINAFFTLSYLEHLWRTPGIKKDLEELDVNCDQIQDKEITASTRQYLSEIEKLNPKSLLGHFLLHVAGFMHGGTIISKKFIEPSNRLTNYQITTHQYDFALANESVGSGSSMGLFGKMMTEIDTIELSSEEYQELFEQCNSVYSTMVSIYDDLCQMHTGSTSDQLTKPIWILTALLMLLALVISLSPQQNNNALSYS